jgi:hypothetical protein
MTSASRPLQFNPFSPAFHDDPYPTYARLRAEEPVHRNALGAWLLTRYDDVSAVLRDPGFGAHDISKNIRSKRRFVDPAQVDPLADAIEQWLMLINPPDHTRLRRLVNRPFTPAAIKQWRPQVDRVVASLLAKVRHTGRMDVVNDLAVPLAVSMISYILGVPEDGQERVLYWTDGISRVLDPLRSLEEYVQMNQVAGEFSEYFRWLFQERRRAPKDDLISALMAAEQQDDQLTERELLSVCMLLFASGEKTTVNLIGNGILALLRHPDQLALLRAQPALLPDAIQELLRYDSPVQLSTRVPSEDTSLHGKAIPAGSLVFVALGAANRDPERFADPDRLDITRSDNRHLAFSAGIHYCLGAALALVEGQAAIGAIVHGLDDIELVSNEVEWQKEIIFRGPRSLPIAFTPAAA